MFLIIILLSLFFCNASFSSHRPTNNFSINNITNDPVINNENSLSQFFDQTENTNNKNGQNNNKNNDIFSELINNLGKLLIKDDESCEEKTNKTQSTLALLSKMKPIENPFDCFVDTLKIISKEPEFFPEEDIEKEIKDKNFNIEKYDISELDNVYGANRYTLLHYACFYHNEEALVELMEKKVKNVVDKGGFFPVSYTRNCDFYAFVKNNYPKLIETSGNLIRIEDKTIKILPNLNLLEDLEKNGDILTKEKPTRKRQLTGEKNIQPNTKKKKTK